MGLQKASLAPRDILRILFRHRRKFAVVFVGTILLTIGGYIICPRSYVSEAKLFVKIGRESVSLDPTATVGATVSIQDSRESEIRSLMDVLESRVLLEQVVARIGAQSILDQRVQVKPEQAGFVQWAQAKLGLKSKSRSGVKADDAIRILEESVQIEANKKSNVIAIRCKAGSPELAQVIVKALVDAYRNQHLAVNATESYEFFAKQVETLKADLTQATSALNQTKSELGLTTVDGERQILETQFNNLNKELSDAEAARSAAQSRVDALRSQLPQTRDEELKTGTGLTQTAIDQMRDTLYQLQIKEREMQSKFKPTHPALVAIHDQVQQVTDILNKQELLVEFNLVESLSARKGALEAQYSDIQQKLKLLNENEVAISQLERRVELLKTNYRNYSEKMEQSRVAQALDKEQVTNLKIVQPASFVAEPVSPKKSIIFLLGLFVATFGGLSVALVCELLDYSFQTPEQVETSLNLPVLLSIPQLSRKGMSYLGV